MAITFTGRCARENGKAGGVDVSWTAFRLREGETGKRTGMHVQMDGATYQARQGVYKLDSEVRCSFGD